MTLRRLLDRLWKRRPASTSLAPSAVHTSSDERARADELIALAIAADDSGDHARAEALCRQAIALAPDYSYGWTNLAIALRAAGRPDESLAAFARAVEADPTSAAAHYNLGRAQLQALQHGAAAATLRTATELRPDYADALILLAEARERTGDADGALDSLRAALEVEPRHAGALNNCAGLLRERGELEEAAALFERVMDVAPDYVEARNALATVLSALGRIADARALAAATLARFPQSHWARAVHLFTMLYDDTLTAGEVAAEHRKVGALFEAEVPPRAAPFRNVRDPEKTLRVGYVSGDFRRHPVALFSAAFLKCHDRSRVTPIGYSSVAVPDEMTARTRALFDEWHDIAAMDDAQAAQKIEADAIDILVDLSGHTTNNRIGVFARRPAPLQATWFSYVSTTGLTAMTYRLCDALIDPPGSEAYSTEELVRLPHSQWCFRPPPAALMDPRPPERIARGPRFGSFNQYAKVSPTTLRLWTELLHAVPGSTLAVFDVAAGSAQQTLVRRFAEAGVPRERLELTSRMAHRDYYDAYRGVDVCLDTIPYSGCTTTCDALWMGVPVVTLPGTRPVSRSTASMLTAAGFPQWIAASEADYVRIAASLATASSADRRVEIRSRMQASPLMDEAGYTRDVEDAYRAMWKRWCAQ